MLHFTFFTDCRWMCNGTKEPSGTAQTYFKAALTLFWDPFIREWLHKLIWDPHYSKKVLIIYISTYTWWAKIFIEWFSLCFNAFFSLFLYYRKSSSALTLKLSGLSGSYHMVSFFFSMNKVIIINKNIDFFRLKGPPRFYQSIMISI